MDSNFADRIRLAASLPSSLPPLAVDIDGTLTDSNRAVDPCVFPILQAWPSELVIATGKAMPYPVALCEFLGIEKRVIAENGGVVIAGRDSPPSFLADPTAANAVAKAYQHRGYSLGWGQANLVNRWRETELAVNRDSPLEPLEEIATAHGLTVVDTGYAYHVHASDVDKGVGLREIASSLEVDPETFAFVGDSPNDVPGFDVAGAAVTVANAPESVKREADYVTTDGYGDGFAEAVEWLCRQCE